MIGRAAYADPALLAEADMRYFDVVSVPVVRAEVLAQYLRYCGTQLAAGVPWNVLARPALALFYRWPGARAWRQRLLAAAGDTAGFFAEN